MAETIEHQRLDGIPIEDFRRAIRRIQEAKGWSLLEMEEIAHVTLSNSIMYGGDRKLVSRQWATMVFRRLAGIGTLPTIKDLERMKKRNMQLGQAVNEVIR